MDKIKMVATVDHPFDNKHRIPGDEYEATENEAMIVEGLGWAKRKQMKAAQKADAKPGNGYNRRDMKAEEKK